MCLAFLVRGVSLQVSCGNLFYESLSQVGGKPLCVRQPGGSDDALKLTPPTIMSLEQCLEFIADDELVEVTPENIRMRKRILSKEQRMKQAFRKK